MHSDVKDLIDRLYAESEKVKLECPMDVKRLFKYCVVPSNQGGKWDQAFTTMVFAEGDSRQMMAYQCFMLCRVIDHEDFTCDQMKVLFKETVPLSAEFIWTCGLEQPWGFVKEMLACFDKIDDKADLKALFFAFNSYFTHYQNWIHWYFPWYVGECFRMRHEEDARDMAEIFGI